MSKQDKSERTEDLPELPIERGFPIERINEIAEKEGRAKQWYRPIYTMHKWWARRNGCVFRAITLYSLLDDPDKIEVYEPGENGTLGDYGGGHSNIENLIDNVDMADPESLWELYPKDVRIGDKKILDPFMGGGTSLVEASRFGVEADGYDLNPVSWFVTKKQLDAGQTEVEELESAYEQVKNDVAEEILDYYRTPCPNGDHDADVMYNFWVKELDCVSCGSDVPLYNDYRVGKGRYENDDKYNVLCPDCGSVILVDDWREECTCDAVIDQSTGKECGHKFIPEEGNAKGSEYTCVDCGQKYSILDAVQEQDGFNLRLYALEYYCPTCEDQGLDKGKVKAYKKAQKSDIELFNEAKEKFEDRDDLKKYVPNEDIPLGIKTDSTKFEGSITGGHNVLRHGFDKWSDMFNDRQLLCLSLMLKSIDSFEDQNVKEYLLLAFSKMLQYNTIMVGYQASRNHINDVFQSNSFDPPKNPAENNIWGTEYGMGTFEAVWDMIIRGVEYANAPTERYIENGDTIETPPFGQKIGENTSVYQGDMRTINVKNEYDAVITDPPYYDNVIYSELSDFFYVWQRVLLKNEYEWFETEKTPRQESIVANPAVQKGATEFEDEIRQAFNTISTALKDDGVLAFTYHHSDVDSWGELLTALCDVGFEVTATYPISADENKFFEGEAVGFDIVIVARPTDDRRPISWNSLRRNIVRTAKQTHQRLTKNRELSEGDIGVIEMGRAFYEYSKHHGEVQRDGEIMSAKEVVDEIYGIIQQGSDIGEVDVFLDLLEMEDPEYSDLNMLTRGTSANPDEMKNMLLYRMDGGEFILGTWQDEKRLAYVQEQVNGDGDNGLTPLEKAQFLRHRYEHGKSIQNYLEKWTVSDDLRELCGELAEASGDDVYNRILGGDRALGDY